MSFSDVEFEFLLQLTWGPDLPASPCRRLPRGVGSCSQQICKYVSCGFSLKGQQAEMSYLVPGVNGQGQEVESLPAVHSSNVNNAMTIWKVSDLRGT